MRVQLGAGAHRRGPCPVAGRGFVGHRGEPRGSRLGAGTGLGSPSPTASRSRPGGCGSRSTAGSASRRRAERRHGCVGSWPAAGAAERHRVSTLRRVWVCHRLLRATSPHSHRGPHGTQWTDRRGRARRVSGSARPPAEGQAPATRLRPHPEGVREPEEGRSAVGAGAREGRHTSGGGPAAISDQGWGELRRQLADKTTRHGGQLVAAERFYPSTKTCSSCGAVKTKLPLSMRTYTCDGCGLVLDRDVNAAATLAAWGERHPLVSASRVGDRHPGGPSAGALRHACGGDDEPASVPVGVPVEAGTSQLAGTGVA